MVLTHGHILRGTVSKIGHAKILAIYPIISVLIYTLYLHHATYAKSIRIHDQETNHVMAWFDINMLAHINIFIYI